MPHRASVRRVNRRALMVAGACVAWAICGCPKSTPPCAYVDRGVDAGHVTIVSGACTELACPLGSSPSASARCVCSSGLSPLLGACVGQETGAKFCGLAARFVNGACETTTCATDQALDLESGACMPQAAIDSASRIKLEEDEHARCHSDGRALVIARGTPFCVSPGDVCARGSRYARGSAAACGAPAGCEAGEVLDEVADRCVRIVHSDRTGYVVDVGAWTRAVLGPDGGVGSKALCQPLLTAEAQSFVVGRVDMRIDLAFPSNDVSLVAPTVIVGSDDKRVVPVPTVMAAMTQLIEPLRMIGGTSTAGVVSTHVVCDLPALESTMATRAKVDGGSN